MGEGGPSFLTGLEGSGEINVVTRAPPAQIQEQPEESNKASPIKNNNLFRAQKASSDKKPPMMYNSKQKKCQYIKLGSQDEGPL